MRVSGAFHWVDPRQNDQTRQKGKNRFDGRHGKINSAGDTAGGCWRRSATASISLWATSRFWPRFKASCQAPVFLVLRVNYPKSAQAPRHVPDRRKSARQMLLPPGRLAPAACNEHTSKTCEIDNALNPFGSWLLEKRCKLGSTASLASTTSQH